MTFAFDMRAQNVQSTQPLPDSEDPVGTIRDSDVYRYNRSVPDVKLDAPPNSHLSLIRWRDPNGDAAAKVFVTRDERTGLFLTRFARISACMGPDSSMLHVELTIVRLILVWYSSLTCSQRSTTRIERPQPRLTSKWICRKVQLVTGGADRGASAYENSEGWVYSEDVNVPRSYTSSSGDQE